MTNMNFQEQIDNTDYWDERVMSLECTCFSDEVILTFVNSKGKVQLCFEQCYSVFFDHEKQYNKNIAVKKMTLLQIPYFLQNIEVTEFCDNGETFFKCTIKMFPLDVRILCKNIVVNITQELGSSANNT